MGFLNPLLLIGTAGIVVPILIHLLNRFRHREVDWGAMELLRRAVVMRSRRIRLEDLLVLLLRCLGILLLALAMARPTITSRGARWLGAERQVGVVIALDGSYSMAYEPGVSSRYDRAMESLEQIRKTLSPGNPVSLVLMGQRPRTLLRCAPYDPGRFAKALEKARALPERLNLQRCLEKLDALMAETKAPVRECHILTDAQRLTWADLPPKARDHLRSISRRGRLFLLPTPPDRGENLAIEHFALESGSLRKDSLARYVAQIRNLGLRPRTDVPVQMFLGDQDVPVHRQVIKQIAPGEGVAVHLFARFRRAGETKVTADIGRDALAVDNVRHAVAPVRGEVRVLCVDGQPDPQRRPFRGAADYLVTALKPTGPGKPGGSLRVETVGHQQLAGESLARYDVILLANVPDLRSAEVGRLQAFVKAGGGLVVFLGDNVIPRLINARMRIGGASLLPAEVLEAVSAPRRARTAPAATPAGGPAAGWTLAAAEAAHPLSRILSLVPAPLLAEACVRRRFRLRVLPEAQPVLTLADGGSPVLAERRLGRGRALLFASTANRDWTNFIVHPVGPMVLHEMVTYLTRADRPSAAIVGEPLVCPLPDRSAATTVEFRAPGPDGRKVSVQAGERGGRTVAEYSQADAPGFYEVEYAQGEAPLVLAANVDASESDVKTLSSEQLTEALAGVPAKLLLPGDDLAAAIKHSRIGIELWLPLMIAGLVVLGVESLLAWRFSRAMTAGQGAAAAARVEAASSRSAA